MSSNYHGVKYYGPNDLAHKHYYKNAINLLDKWSEENDLTDINVVLELYNSYKYYETTEDKSIYPTLFSYKVKSLKATIARFFKTMSDDTFIYYYRCVSFEYLDDFWTLIDKNCVYKNISKSVFQTLLNEPNNSLNLILEHHALVSHFDEVLANYMRNSNQSAIIIIKNYLEIKPLNSKVNCYLPKTLSPYEREAIIEKYIDSENPNYNLLKLVESSQNVNECPLSDSLRLKARKKAYLVWETIETQGISVSYGVGVCIKKNPDLISFKEIKPLEYQITYDIDWIKNNLDYPTLLNNFIYIFGFVDLDYRCSFVSVESKLGLTERILGIRGIKEYKIGTAFRIAEMKSSAELKAYSAVLSEFNICIEDLVQWFFSEYLEKNFKVRDFMINMPSYGSTMIEKCRTLSAEMDGILKQYRMFVTNHNIDRELFEMSSHPIRFSEIPSMIKRKYAYANSNEIAREQFLLFSDQSMLNYLPRLGNARSFFELVNNSKVYLSDYTEGEVATIKWLEERNSIFIEKDGTIGFNLQRVYVLRDLYLNEALCVSYHNDNDSIEMLVASGDLRYESSLFSIPEQHYLNFILNKSEYSNGLDIRNKYIHGTYPLEDSQQMQDYLLLLKIMIILVLKINEEFCLLFPE